MSGEVGARENVSKPRPAERDSGLVQPAKIRGQPGQEGGSLRRARPDKERRARLSACHLESEEVRTVEQAQGPDFSHGDRCRSSQPLLPEDVQGRPLPPRPRGAWSRGPEESSEPFPHGRVDVGLAVKGRTARPAGRDAHRLGAPARGDHGLLLVLPLERGGQVRHFQARPEETRTVDGPCHGRAFRTAFSDRPGPGSRTLQGGVKCFLLAFCKRQRALPAGWALRGWGAGPVQGRTPESGFCRLTVL
jgi:hypothetical protein